MGRTATIFIVFCMGVIAASVAAIVIFQFGRPFGEAVSLSLALMCTMVVVHLLVGRSRDRGAVSEAVDRLEDRLADIDEDVGNLEGRLTGVEHTFPRKTRAEIDPLFAEVEVLGTLVKQMAEAMSDIETRIEDQKTLAPPPAAPALPGYQTAPEPVRTAQQALPHASPHGDPSVRASALQPGHDDTRYAVEHRASAPAYTAPQPLEPPDEPPPAAAAPSAAPAVPGTPASAPVPQSDPAMRELITSALNGNRVELHLQPIVTLPQRQVRFYEAFSRLRDTQGQLIEAAVFMPEAVRSRQIARIDNLLLFRSVQVIRRLTSRNRNAALFCNISSLSLVDETFFPGFLEFVNSNRNYADVLIFEFSQADIADMGVVEHESLSALAELGFRFSVDRITDMRMDFKALAHQGFKYAKMHADFLIGRRTADHGHIHPSDFADLLHRYGMELIPDRVETESQVLELLDYEVSLAQGNLFSPPRPVRAEVLQGTPAPTTSPRKQRAAE
ncbi:MAG: EAL domain-containing protein [Roseibium sp.]|nr:EAL domain-containing protein [Roseibium sp.]